MAEVKADAWLEGGYTDTDTGGIKWSDLEKLLNLDEEYNRVDRGNAFGAWEYDPETKSQNFVAKSPGMIAAQDRMDRRLAGEGFAPYEAPSQISSMTDALMATRMEKMGLMDSGVADLKQDDYGTRFADRSGSPTQVPTQAAAPVMPPGGGQPPGGGTGQPGDIPPISGGGVGGGGNRNRPPMRPHGMSDEEWMTIQAMQGM